METVLEETDVIYGVVEVTESKGWKEDVMG